MSKKSKKKLIPESCYHQIDTVRAMLSMVVDLTARSPDALIQISITDLMPIIADMEGKLTTVLDQIEIQV